MPRAATNRDRKPWTFYASAEDRANIEDVRHAYGLKDGSSAVRFAMSYLAKRPIDKAAKQAIAEAPVELRGRMSSKAAKAASVIKPRRKAAKA